MIKSFFPVPVLVLVSNFVGPGIEAKVETETALSLRLGRVGLDYSPDQQHRNFNHHLILWSAA